MAFSPDAATLATGGFDGTVRLWDTASGTLRKTLHHESWVSAVSISPDGKVLISGGGGNHNLIKVWDLDTGEPTRILDAHARHIEHLTFSPDGKTLASSSGDGTVKLWQVATWEPLRTFAGHDDDVGSVAFSSDGALLVTSSDDATVRVWEAESARLISALQWQPHPILWATFSPDGKQIATAGYVQNQSGTDGNARMWTGEVRIWNVATWETEAVLSEETDAVFFLIYTGDGKHLIGATADGYLLVWDAKKLSLKQKLQSHKGFVNKLAFSSDETLLASASFDETAKVWSCTL